MDLQKLIASEIANGYSADMASAKVCQDLILLAISKSNFKNNVTIKGGVIMRSKTQNTRRATQDLDLDLLHYSISDESIKGFLKKLNCIEDISIEQTGKLQVLKQQDYQGKRALVVIRDKHGNSITSKIDIGVHKDFDIKQEEHCFEISFDEEGASLFVNPSEQLFAEKLGSLLRLGTFSTRAKDIYDMYYLSKIVDEAKLLSAINSLILDNDKMRENSMDEIISRIQRIFKDDEFKNFIEKSNKRWLDDPVEAMFDGILKLLDGLSHL